MNATRSFVTLVTLAALAAGVLPAHAQPRQTGTLRVVVRDPSGAVIPNATVAIKGSEAATASLVVPDVVSDGQGIATAENVPAGRYAVTAAFPGFEARTLTDVRVRAGDNKRDVTLPIERVAESVAVGRDAATSASDPKSERFSNVLSRDQI